MTTESDASTWTGQFAGVNADKYAVTLHQSPSKSTRAAAGDGALDYLRGLLIFVRWGSVLLIVLLMNSKGHFYAYDMAALLCYSVLRTVFPLKRERTAILTLFWIYLELGFDLVLLTHTGAWNSPFIPAVVTVVVAGAFEGGWTGAIQIATASIVSISLIYQGTEPDPELSVSIKWSLELGLIAGLAGYARVLFFDAQAQTSAALQRMQQLSAANTLLYELNQLAQTMPTSLDMSEVVDATLANANELVTADNISLLLFDDMTDDWHLIGKSGLAGKATFTTTDLPSTVAKCANGTSSTTRSNHGGFSPDSKDVMAAILRARGNKIGILTAESHQEKAFSEHDERVIVSLAEQAALALDNARWFDRLRLMGADQERMRLARDLHDRVGQSLAYIGIELDRFSKEAGDANVSSRLLELREDVTRAIGEVRETLYDLHTDVSETNQITDAIKQYSDRVQARSGITIEVDSQSTSRIPLPQEREMWRITQEAVNNAERHSNAKHIKITWSCNDAEAQIVVHDDGRGFDSESDSRDDSYGLRGMRNRAAAIGAYFVVDSSEESGTRIECRLERK